MSDQPKGKNGLSRVLARCRFEWKTYQRDVTLGVYEEWRWEPWNSHHFVDVFVESERVPEAAYLRGHFWFLVVLLSGLSNVALLGLWLGWWSRLASWLAAL
jgi:hypothetical protein